MIPTMLHTLELHRRNLLRELMRKRSEVQVLAGPPHPTDQRKRWPSSCLEPVTPMDTATLSLARWFLGACKPRTLWTARGFLIVELDRPTVFPRVTSQYTAPPGIWGL
jgi:hypothetical protein